MYVIFIEENWYRENTNTIYHIECRLFECAIHAGRKALANKRAS